LQPSKPFTLFHHLKPPHERASRGFLLTVKILFFLISNEFIFTGWSGDCTGSAIVTTTLIDVPKRCVAHFHQIPTPSVVKWPVERFPCPPEEMLNWICNAHGRTLQYELEIRSWGNLSNAVVVLPIHNHGWASNLLIQPAAEVVGGTVPKCRSAEGF